MPTKELTLRLRIEMDESDYHNMAHKQILDLIKERIEAEVEMAMKPLKTIPLKVTLILGCM